jgi:general transcription factor IIIA
MRRHLATHEKKEQYRCRDYAPCAETFRKHQTLQRHIESAHMNRKPFRCCELDSKTGKPCEKGFDQVGQLNAHISRNHVGERYWCTECPSGDSPSGGNTDEAVGNLGFVSYNDLLAHNRDVHPPQCSVCKKTFARSSELDRHFEVHLAPMEDRKTFFCQEMSCDKSFVSQKTLNDHVRTAHEGIKKFVCGETAIDGTAELESWDGQNACGKAFTYKKVLQDHVRSHHLGLPRTQRKTTRAAKKDADTGHGRRIKESTRTVDRLTGAAYENSGREITCTVSYCPFRFSRVSDLGRHLASKHMMDEVEVAEALAEKEALSGGKFWIGGIEDDEEGLPISEEVSDDELDEVEFARLLEADVGRKGGQGQHLRRMDLMAEAEDWALLGGARANQDVFGTNNGVIGSTQSKQDMDINEEFFADQALTALDDELIDPLLRAPIMLNDTEMS